MTLTRARGAHTQQYRPVERRRAVKRRASVEYVSAPSRGQMMQPLVDAGLSSAEAYALLRTAWALEATERDQ